jgi:hypothetical protein
MLIYLVIAWLFSGGLPEASHVYPASDGPPVVGHCVLKYSYLYLATVMSLCRLGGMRSPGGRVFFGFARQGL